MKKYVLENSFLRLTLLDVGATIFSLIKKDSNTNMVFTMKEKDYLNNQECHGTIVGPAAGRICGKNIKINGKKYEIPEFHKFLLHSGEYRISNQKWDLIKKSKTKISFGFFYENKIFPFLSPQKIIVVYKLHKKRVVCIIKSVSNSLKIMNYTNHVYFTLGANDARNLLLKVNHEKMLETTNDGFITGKILNNWSDYLNFANYKNTSFIDNPFLLKKKRRKIFLKNPKNGIKLHVSTNQKIAVVYNDCYSRKKKYKGIAIECQGFPSAITYDDWPQNIFKKRTNKTTWSFDF